MKFGEYLLILWNLIVVLINCIYGQVNTDLSLGDLCRVNDGIGTCKFIYDCRKAIIDIQAGLGRNLCRSGEMFEVVCCPDSDLFPTDHSAASQVNAPIDTLRMADRKCREYSNYVYDYEMSPALIDNTPGIHREKKCGFPDPMNRIVGGTVAEPKEFPHMARLGYSNGNSISWLCGGSIISRRFILTAAHCIVTSNGPPTFVRIGDLNFDSDTDDAKPRTISVARNIPYPAYRSHQKYHDIGLVELVQDMRFDSYARPACLNTDFNFSETQVIATGCGATLFAGDSSDPQLKVTLEMFDFPDCSSKYGTDILLNRGFLPVQQMCAGSRMEEKDTCQGDSGGPLQVYHELHCMYKLVGVTSFGRACGTPGDPGVYARVSKYINWLERRAFKYE